MRRRFGHSFVLLLIFALLTALALCGCTELGAGDSVGEDVAAEHDKEAFIDWYQVLTPMQENYTQIIKDSPFKLGQTLRGTYYEAENSDYMEQCTRGWGTYPYIDGSTVCVPMAIQFARQHLGMDFAQAYTLGCYFSTTKIAHRNLIDKRSAYSPYYEEGDSGTELLRDRPIELFLGTELSEEEQAYADKQKVTLIQEPICHDAFVFIVNKDNPVDSLTTEQIRNIYSGKIKNWKEVGGRDEAITAFQREANSGSQTAMENLVMKGEKLIEAKTSQVASEMAGLIDGIAEYDNAASSIGYTYRYFIDIIYPSDKIKILKIDGVAPEDEAVRGGSYPYSTNYYGIIRAEDGTATAGRFLDWMLSAEGQSCIAASGYTPVR
jgi:phosphate transport system substrate-binding protein